MPTLVLSPDRFAAGGEAIARDQDGRIVFVRGALPGETVVAEITHEKRDWARGHVIDVTTASPDRIAPPCPARLAGCGGCGWLHITHEGQRAAKVGIVADALRRIGGVTEPVVELGGTVPAEGYRGLGDSNLAELGIPSEQDYVALYCERTGRDVIPPAQWRFALAFAMFRNAAIRQGVFKRALDGNASSDPTAPST